MQRGAPQWGEGCSHGGSCQLESSWQTLCIYTARTSKLQTLVSKLQQFLPECSSYRKAFVWDCSISISPTQSNCQYDAIGFTIRFPASTVQMLILQQCESSHSPHKCPNMQHICIRILSNMQSLLVSVHKPGLSSTVLSLQTQLLRTVASTSTLIALHYNVFR